MSSSYVYLTSTNGLRFRLSYSPMSYQFVLFNTGVGSLAISSRSIHRAVDTESAVFTLYLDQAYLEFSISDLSALDDFLKSVHFLQAAA